jgi:hypothetical protein
MQRMPRPAAPRPPARTRLALALREPPRRRATPLDLYALARRWWLAGERVDVGALAARLKIGRATAFRWVGSRELLLGEILWALCDDLMKQAAAATRGRGAPRIAAICEAVIRAIVAFEPLRRFVRHDPEYALRLLTSKAGPVQARAIECVRELLRHEAERGALDPPLKLDTLAYLLVRLCESFIYADVVSGQQVDVVDAGLAVQLLLSGRVGRRAPVRSAAEDRPSKPRPPRQRRAAQTAAVAARSPR